MQGYTLTSAQQIKSEGLNINLGAPLSMMLQTTWSQLNKAPDAGTDKTQFRLPSQLSIFYAGRSFPGSIPEYWLHRPLARRRLSPMGLGRGACLGRILGRLQPCHQVNKPACHPSFPNRHAR